MASDPATIAALYAEEHLRLHRRFRRRGLPEAIASDLVQESFVRLLRSRTPEIENLRAYLYSAADSAERDMRRAEVRSGRIIDPVAEPDESAADPRPQVETALITTEEEAALSAMIRALPPRAREVLFLHKFENLSYAQIAERLGISRNTVMVHMVKALGLLRRQLGASVNSGD